MNENRVPTPKLDGEEHRVAVAPVVEIQRCDIDGLPKRADLLITRADHGVAAVECLVPVHQRSVVVIEPFVTLTSCVAGKLSTLTVPVTVWAEDWLVIETGIGLAGELTMTTCWMRRARRCAHEEPDQREREADDDAGGTPRGRPKRNRAEADSMARTSRASAHSARVGLAIGPARGMSDRSDDAVLAGGGLPAPLRWADDDHEPYR